MKELERIADIKTGVPCLYLTLVLACTKYKQGTTTNNYSQ